MANAATAAAEPTWLTERRRKGAALAQELELPGPKTPGWEFTDLSELIEADFTLPEGADPGARVDNAAAASLQRPCDQPAPHARPPRSEGWVAERSKALAC